MDKVKFSTLPIYVAVKPELSGQLVVPVPTTKERIISRIQYLMEFYIPVLVVFATWIGLVIWGGEYLASR